MISTRFESLRDTWVSGNGDVWRSMLWSWINLAASARQAVIFEEFAISTDLEVAETSYLLRIIDSVAQVPNTRSRCCTHFSMLAETSPTVRLTHQGLINHPVLSNERWLRLRTLQKLMQYLSCIQLLATLQAVFWSIRILPSKCAWNLPAVLFYSKLSAFLGRAKFTLPAPPAILP